VLDFAQDWFQKREAIIFHDPLAATTIFDPQICAFHQGQVTVELTSPQALGMTYWDPDSAPGPHEVALEVDRDRFFAHYFSVFQ
jgi:purine nucleosidase